MARIEHEFIIRDTHRGLWYEDGVLVKVLEAGRYEIPDNKGFFGRKGPKVEVSLVDMRERDLTIKGQEILTADKVALRVSIIVQFRVVDPKLALHAVEKYEDRLYSDVQLAARRSLATMTLEEILTNRNRLSEDILRDVEKHGRQLWRHHPARRREGPGFSRQPAGDHEQSARRRTHEPGATRRSPHQGRRAKDRVASKADAQRLEAEAHSAAERLAAQSQAEVQRLQTEAEIKRLQERERTAQAYAKHPALLRMLELETLRELGENANARIYIGFDKHAVNEAAKDGD